MDAGQAVLPTIRAEESRRGASSRRRFANTTEAYKDFRLKLGTLVESEYLKLQCQELSNYVKKSQEFWQLLNTHRAATVSMTRSLFKYQSACLVGTTFILLGAVAAPSQATTLVGFATEGDMMSGMRVTASFLDGTSQTSIWGATGDDSGGAFGSGWSLTESGNSFYSPWTFSNNSGTGITSLVIDAISGNSLFDIYPDLSGSRQTPGSADGRAFETTSGQGPNSSAYTDIIDISNGDLFGTLSLYWNDGFTGTMQFGADTDSGRPDDPVKARDPVTRTTPPTVRFSARTIYEGRRASATLYGNDAGEDAITFFLNGVYKGTDFNRSGTRSVSTKLGFFADNGRYNYRAKATDEDGNDSEPVTGTLNVLNVAPSVTLLQIPTIYEGSSARARMNAIDPGADSVSFFLYGNGGRTKLGTDTRIRGTRSASGSLGFFADNTTIPYTGYALDKDGGRSKRVSGKLRVLNVAPTLTTFDLLRPVIYEGQSARARMSATDPGADSVRFFINGNSAGIDLQTYGTRRARKNLGTFADEGEFTFRAIAQDKDEAYSNRLIRELKVLNVAPTITDLTDDLIINTNELFDFAATATDPGIYDRLKFAWDFDGDGRYNDFRGASGQWSWAEAGTHEVKLRVRDGDGGFDYASFTVTAVTVDRGTTEKIPEPSSLLGILAFGGLGAGAVLKRKRQKHNNGDRCCTSRLPENAKLTIAMSSTKRHGSFL